jgi:hypothetical protein
MKRKPSLAVISAVLVALFVSGLAAARATVFGQQAMLRASNGAIRDAFGRSVAVAGDTIVVGAEFNKVGTRASQGEAYVFVQPRSGWANATETAKLVASDGRSGDLFGEAVAISGDTIVVAAPFHKVGTHARQGEIYVFTRPAKGWSGTLRETARLITSDGAANDYVGGALAISGDTIVAGAYPHRVGSRAEQGKVYVFVKPRSGWAGTLRQTGALIASNGASGDWFGWSVGISGTTVVTGAPLYHQPRGDGEAYVFVKPHSGWAGTHTEAARLIATGGRPGNSLGATVAVSGATIAAGAPDHKVGSHPYQGVLYVYTKPASGWSGTRTQTGTLIASDGFGKIENGDVFADELGDFSLAISGDTIVSSSIYHTVRGALDQGEAYAFVRPQSGWAGTHTESARLTASNGHAGDSFGESVAIDGHTTVVGAPDHVPVNPLTPGPGAAYAFAVNPDAPPVGLG